MKAAGGKVFGAHLAHLSVLALGFPDFPSSVVEPIPLTESDETAKLMLRYLHLNADPPSTEKLTMSAILGVAEAAEKYHIHFAREILLCTIRYATFYRFEVRGSDACDECLDSSIDKSSILLEPWLILLSTATILLQIRSQKRSYLNHLQRLECLSARAFSMHGKRTFSVLRTFTFPFSHIMHLQLRVTAQGHFSVLRRLYPFCEYA